MSRLFRSPKLTRKRLAFAMVVAMLADALQVMLAVLGPVGMLADEIIDIIAMILIVFAIGFHPLLLPTFVVEIVPIIEMLPTWTACVGAVIFLKKRNSGETIPIQATVTSEPVNPPKP
jgi:hypothetical protein